MRVDEEAREAARIAGDLGMPVSNFASYPHGFKFTTESELDAYKAAYQYRGMQLVTVNKSQDNWQVQVHT